MPNKKKYSDKELDEMSAEDLMTVAQERDLKGRSTMSKDELATALKGDGAPSGEVPGPNTTLEQVKAQTKEDQKGIAKTDPAKSANENVEAGGHPTGTVPGGTS